MSPVLMKVLQVILALSVLIIFHEAGHFFWARIFRIRVDKFFLFFDAWGVKLFSTRMPWFQKLFPASARWETEYGIGWLPLGGYCKIAGMIDESMDTESLKQDPQPWEFRSKPAWQRLLVMVGGVLNNFLLAIALFIAILAIWGDNYIPNNSPIYVNELGEELGFRTGDRILLYDDYAPEDFLLVVAGSGKEEELSALREKLESYESGKGMLYVKDLSQALFQNADYYLAGVDYETLECVDYASDYGVKILSALDEDMFHWCGGSRDYIGERIEHAKEVGV